MQNTLKKSTEVLVRTLKTMREERKAAFDKKAKAGLTHISEAVTQLVNHAKDGVVIAHIETLQARVDELENLNVRKAHDFASRLPSFDEFDDIVGKVELTAECPPCPRKFNSALYMQEAGQFTKRGYFKFVKASDVEEADVIMLPDSPNLYKVNGRDSTSLYTVIRLQEMEGEKGFAVIVPTTSAIKKRVEV